MCSFYNNHPETLVEVDLLGMMGLLVMVTPAAFMDCCIPAHLFLLFCNKLGAGKCTLRPSYMEPGALVVHESGTYESGT